MEAVPVILQTTESLRRRQSKIKVQDQDSAHKKESDGAIFAREHAGFQMYAKALHSDIREMRRWIAIPFGRLVNCNWIFFGNTVVREGHRSLT